VLAPPGVPSDSWGQAALLPGLVNCHTHLELTGFEGLAPEAEFPAWIRRIIALKADRSSDQFLAQARQGVRDCWAGGVTTVADTGDSGAVIQALAELGGSGIAYHEVFGPHPDQVETSMAGLERQLDRLATFTGPRVRLGVSPHAPFSVSGPLYTRAAVLARARGLPLAVHIAESVEESRLLATGTGSFATAWTARNIPLPGPLGDTPLGWLDRHGVLGPDTLCVHCIDAGPADRDRLVRHGAAVAHCPRSNRRHGHGTAPLAALRGRGLRVGLGTDSVASVAPLDLGADAALAGALATLRAPELIRMLTLDGARALGLDREIGSLAPGKWGDLVVVDLPEAVDAASLEGTLLARLRGHVSLTLVGGRAVFRREQTATGPAFGDRP
jgi:5-methylthioadenosine/S-adenosylhomocysteine deaminase